MNRRNFFATVTPLLAAASAAQAQIEIGAGARPALRAAPAAAGVEAKSAAAPKAAKGPTEITSQEATFDNRAHLATFNGEVEVKDPEFHLTCDKLTVYLRKPKGDAAKPAEPRAIGAEGAPAAAPAKEKEESGIDRAIAEGNVIITQEKKDADGKLQRYYGKAKKAVFDNNKQTCVLYGWPRVSQSLGENMGKQVIAMQESTVITLDQAGKIVADGPNKVTLADVDAFQKPGAR